MTINNKEQICKCGHPKNEHLETIGECRHYFDPTLKEVEVWGEDARGTYCTCKGFRLKENVN